MKNIVIFGSGKGSNAINIIEYFKDHSSIRVKALASNKPRRGFLDISYEYRINLELINGIELQDEKWLHQLNENYNPDLIVLAGYNQLIPSVFLQKFEGKIINIHPALLPNFGGKGMYGNKVHQAVIDSKAKESGITIHYINNNYDEGEIIFQAKCTVEEIDSADTLAHKIHLLEYTHYSLVIEQILNSK